MKILAQTIRDLQPPRNELYHVSGLLALAIVVLVTCACSLPTRASEPASSVEQTAEGLRSGYRQQQWSRLANAQDRDNLIAAVLLVERTSAASK